MIYDVKSLLLLLLLGTHSTLIFLFTHVRIRRHRRLEDDVAVKKILFVVCGICCVLGSRFTMETIIPT
jgi:hypothetical protein